MHIDSTATRPTPNSRQKLVEDIAAVASEASELLKEFSDDKLLRTRQAMTQAQAAISASARSGAPQREMKLANTSQPRQR